MADVTIGFKGSEDLREKVKAMVDASGMGSSKEWFESLIRLAEVEQLKAGATDFSKDLSELSLHTNRINELITNMVKRAAFEKAEIEKKVEEVRESKDSIIISYQVENSELKAEIEQLKKEVDDVKKEAEEAHEEQKQLLENVENQKALIGEYKEKIDTLSGLVNEYKAAAEENKMLVGVNRGLQEELKKQSELAEKLYNESEGLIAQHKLVLLEKENAHRDSLAATNSQAEQNLQALAERHAADMERVKERHEIEMDRIQERKDMEKERELLALRTEMQNKQQELVEAHAKKIEELYQELRKGKGNS